MKLTLAGALGAASRAAIAVGAAIVAAVAVPQARAQTAANPLQDPSILRIREAFAVDGIALFDPHAQHAARMGICAASVFAGLKWCVSGTGEETKGDATYVKTTGYNIDPENRIVYAISTRRGYPLKRDGFEAVIASINARFGAGAAVYAFRAKSAEGAEVDSVIAVWGGLRLVHLTESEYAVVEGGGSLKRGHLVDHRFNLVVSAKLREPVYKIEGEAGYILHFLAAGADRADIVARAAYAPVFLPTPAKPADVPGNPIAHDAVKPPKTVLPDRGGDRDVAAERGRRADAERALAAERLLREEAERKLLDTQRALEELKKRGQSDRQESDDRARRAQAEHDQAEREAARRKAAEDRRAAQEQIRRAEAEQKAAEERHRKEEAERKAAAERQAAEDRRARDEAERKAREEQAKRADTPRPGTDQGGPEERTKPADERERERAREREREREAERVQRKAEADRQAEAERAARDRAARTEDWYRKAAEAATQAGIAWTIAETQDRAAEERSLFAQAIVPGPDGAGIEINFECTVGRDRRLKATARGFDRNTGARVPFRSEGEGAFRVKTQIKLDDRPAQDGLLFRDSDDDIVSIVEAPLTPDDVSIKAARAGAWLRHHTVAIEFRLMAGTLRATVTPYAANLRRVLEACAE